jgi:hypothetical protein
VLLLRCLCWFLAWVMIVGAAGGAFGMDFGAFSEEYREVEDGSGHLLRILRVLRGFEALSVRPANTMWGISWP